MLNTALVFHTALMSGIFTGFSCLSQSYQTYQLQTENSVINMKEPEAPKSVQNNKRDDRFDLVNDASLQSLSSEAAKLRNETRETMTIRFAYQEMQLQYLRLEKKYRDLSQQYRAQKKVINYFVPVKLGYFSVRTALLIFFSYKGR